MVGSDRSQQFNRSMEAIQQASRDRAEANAKVVADQICKGDDKQHKAHMQMIKQKFIASKQLQQKTTAKKEHVARLKQELLNQQLANTYLQEDIDSQVDDLTQLRRDVDLVKKEMQKTASRNTRYLTEIAQMQIESQSTELEKVRTQLKLTNSTCELAQKRRDACFTALCDITVER